MDSQEGRGLYLQGKIAIVMDSREGRGLYLQEKIAIAIVMDS
jgi:hypothetical protein